MPLKNLTSEWRSNFITMCVGLMTIGVASSVGLMVDLKVSMAQARDVDVRQSSDILEISAKIETLRNEVSANVLEIVRVRAQCEQSWVRPPKP